MRQTTFSSSAYMAPLLDPTTLMQRVTKMVEALTPHADTFDTIAFSGYSGAVLGPILAMRMDKNMLLVRKDTNNTHSSYLIEGTLNSRYIIADDLVCSGATAMRIQKSIFQEESKSGRAPEDCSVCVGVIQAIPEQGQFEDRYLEFREAREILSEDQRLRIIFLPPPAAALNKAPAACSAFAEDGTLKLACIPPGTSVEIGTMSAPNPEWRDATPEEARPIKWNYNPLLWKGELEQEMARMKAAGEVPGPESVTQERDPAARRGIVLGADSLPRCITPILFKRPGFQGPWFPITFTP